MGESVDYMIVDRSSSDSALNKVRRNLPCGDEVSMFSFNETNPICFFSRSSITAGGDSRVVEWVDRYAERFRELTDPEWERMLGDPKSHWYRNGAAYRSLFGATR